MRRIFFVIILFLFCASFARAQDAAGSNKEQQRIPLTAEQSLQIAQIQKVLADVDILPLDEWLDGFRKDPNPDAEIAVWKKIAAAYTYYLKGRTVTPEYKKEVFKVLVASSAMPREDVPSNVGVAKLSAQEIMAIMDLYYDQTSVTPGVAEVRKTSL